MKLITLLLAVAILPSLFSCASGGKEEATAEVPIPAASFKFTMVKHSMADYAAWKDVYMAHDSMRNAFGLSRYVLGRGTDDPSMVFIANKMTDLQKAKEFATHPDLKMTMEKAGVTSQPSFAYAEMVRLDTTTNDQKNRVLISHRVKDFDVWLKAYDAEGRAARTANGLADRAIARDLEDPNMVYIAFAIADRAKADARMQSEELKKIMTDAGVEGPPTFFYYTIDPSN